jgi:hypothetical protein
MSHPSIHPSPAVKCRRRHVEPIKRHESIQYVEGSEPDADFLKSVDRLLISHEPNVNTFLQLFRNMYEYYTIGKDTYWRKNNDRIADPIPCSQAKFWDYKEAYEKWTHPDFRYDTNAPSNADVDMKLMERCRTPKVTYSPLDPHEMYQRMKCPNEDAM